MVWSLIVWLTVPVVAGTALVVLIPGGELTSIRRRRAARQLMRDIEDRAREGDGGREPDRDRGAGPRPAPPGRVRRRDRAESTGPQAAPDPFDALTVQTRLGIVAEHLRVLEEDPHAWARAERMIASQLAYDALLAEACRLAGVEVLPRAKGDPWERLREEVELAARGWTW